MPQDNRNTNDRTNRGTDEQEHDASGNKASHEKREATGFSTDENMGQDENHKGKDAQRGDEESI